MEKHNYTFCLRTCGRNSLSFHCDVYMFFFPHETHDIGWPTSHACWNFSIVKLHVFFFCPTPAPYLKPLPAGDCPLLVLLGDYHHPWKSSSEPTRKDVARVVFPMICSSNMSIKYAHQIFPWNIFPSNIPTTWAVPKMGVPQNRLFIMDNPSIRFYKWMI